MEALESHRIVSTGTNNLATILATIGKTIVEKNNNSDKTALYFAQGVSSRLVRHCLF
jgi:hypothetical protein